MFHAGAQIGFQSVKPFDAELSVRRSPTSTIYTDQKPRLYTGHFSIFLSSTNFCLYIASLITTRQL
jgi:hypothetical protein